MPLLKLEMSPWPAGQYRRHDQKAIETTPSFIVSIFKKVEAPTLDASILDDARSDRFAPDLNGIVPSSA